MTPFQVSVGEQSVLESTKGPETVMLLTETPVVPVFVTQTLLAALVVFFETRLRETSFTRVLGALIGGGIGLAVARGPFGLWRAAADYHA